MMKKKEMEDPKRNKTTTTTRSSIVERVKRNKRKLRQDSSYMCGTPKGIASKEKWKKRARRKQRA